MECSPKRSRTRAAQSLVTCLVNVYLREIKKLNLLADKFQSVKPKVIKSVPHQKQSTMLSMASYSHFSKTYHLLRKKLDEGTSGVAHLAINRTTATKLYVLYLHTGDISFLEKLKAELVVLKEAVCTPGARTPSDECSASIRREVKLLTGPFPLKHPRIIEVLDHHVDEKVQWLTMPYLPWGTAANFITDNRIPVSFVWHIGYQLAEAVSYLLFGITDTNTMKVHGLWSRVAHKDFHPGNILLKPNKDGFGNFPDIVLADFGHAKVITEEDSQTAAVHQIKEVENIAHVMALLSESLNNTTMKNAIEQLEMVYRFKPDSNDTRFLVDILSKWMDLAKREREAQYEPLPKSVVEEMNARMISNEELDWALGFRKCGAPLPTARDFQAAYMGEDWAVVDLEEQ